jgi:flagellar hook-associated protein 3 FlgL
MRVTEHNKYLSLVDRLRTNQSRLQETIEQISSGKKVNRPSDDPVAAAMLSRIESADARQNAYLEVNARVREEMQAADAALGNADDIMVRVKELTVQMASGLKSQAVLDGGADEIAEMREALVQTINTKHQGRYLFGGIADDQPPYDAGGYVGSTRLRQVEVAPTTKIEQLSGAEAFAGNIDIPFVLDQLEQALRAGDQDAARALITDIDGSIEQLNHSRQIAGSRLDALDHAAAFSEAISFQSEVDASRLESTDVAEAASRLESITSALQATAEVAGRLKSSDLLMKL